MSTLGLLLAVTVAPAIESSAPAMAPGEQGTLSVTILEQPDPDLPLRVFLQAPGGLTLLENRLGWSHVVDRQAVLPRLEGRFRAPMEPGTVRVTGRVRYWVCDDAQCRLRDRPLSIAVTVRARGG